MNAYKTTARQCVPQESAVDVDPRTVDADISKKMTKIVDYLDKILRDTPKERKEWIRSGLVTAHMESYPEAHLDLFEAKIDLALLTEKIERREILLTFKEALIFRKEFNSWFNSLVDFGAQKEKYGSPLATKARGELRKRMLEKFRDSNFASHYREDYGIITPEDHFNAAVDGFFKTKENATLRDVLEGESKRASGPSAYKTDPATRFTPIEIQDTIAEIVESINWIVRQGPGLMAGIQAQSHSLGNLIEQVDQLIKSSPSSGRGSSELNSIISSSSMDSLLSKESVSNSASVNSPPESLPPLRYLRRLSSTDSSPKYRTNAQKIAEMKEKRLNRLLSSETDSPLRDCCEIARPNSKKN